MLLPALALTAAITVATPQAEPLVLLSMGTLRAAPDLALHLADPGPGSGASLALDGAPRRRSAVGGPVCSGDVCQAVVTVPGFEPGYSGRDARTEMFVALLTRAHIEPVATVAWALFSTGLRVDFSPAVFDATSSGAPARGWGSLTVRLRLRIDARGGVVIPPRPR